jgi:hypothetical protein
MRDQQVGEETAETKLLAILPPPGMISHRCQARHYVNKVDIEWIIPQFSLLDAFKNWGSHSSSEFCHQGSSQNWKLDFKEDLSDIVSNFVIQLRDASGELLKCCAPTRVTIAISNVRREKIFPQQHCLPKDTNHTNHHRQRPWS